MRIILTVLFLIINFGEWQSEKVKILIIGDSISIAYTPFVQEALSDNAIVVHSPGNAQHSGIGLAKLDEWIGEEQWDIIQFNWGLWDICYRHPDSEIQGNRDKINGTQTFSLKEYRANLSELVKRLKKTNAKLIFITTSYVPEGEAGGFSGDEIKFNKVAKKVMWGNDILVNDIHRASKNIHLKHAKAPDDVHYTKEGSQMLAVEIVNFLKKEI